MSVTPNVVQDNMDTRDGVLEENQDLGKVAASDTNIVASSKVVLNTDTNKAAVTTHHIISANFYLSYKRGGTKAFTTLPINGRSDPQQAAQNCMAVLDKLTDFSPRVVTCEIAKNLSTDIPTTPTGSRVNKKLMVRFTKNGDATQSETRLINIPSYAPQLQTGNQTDVATYEQLLYDTLKQNLGIFGDDDIIEILG